MAEQKIISITMTSGMDVLAELISVEDDGITVKNPQMYVPMSNQFVPFIVTAAIQDRIVTLPSHSIVLATDPLPAFEHAYTDMFLATEEESDEPTSAIAQNMKQQNDMLEAASPVHGESNTTESGIILA